MSQTCVTGSSFISLFINHLQSSHCASTLDNILWDAIREETQFRHLLATNPRHVTLACSYAGLIDVFDAPQVVRTIRARTFTSERERNAHHVIPLPEGRRRQSGEMSTAPDMQSFQRRWDAFTMGLLSELECWQNIIAAGGSVLACLAPLAVGEERVAELSRWALTHHFINSSYEASGIDLFIWGLSHTEAERKINKIFSAVRDAIPLDLVCVRTRNTISIHSSYPYRPIVISLRLYRSPAEVLAEFDVDSTCVAYDGKRVWANPRAVVSLMRQANTFDMNRHSPDYEMRLAKYADRGFEIYVPGLRREDILQDPDTYDRGTIGQVHGFARLLVLEQNPFWRRLLTSKRDPFLTGGVGVLSQEAVPFLVPQGPEWTPISIAEYVLRVDRILNGSGFSGCRLHRHVAFCGPDTASVMKAPCKKCPKPSNDNELQLQEEYSAKYIRGTLRMTSTALVGSLNGGSSSVTSVRDIVRTC